MDGRQIGCGQQPLEEPVLDVEGDVGATRDGAEHDPLDHAGGQQEVEERVDVGKAGQRGRPVEGRGVDRGQQQREEEGGEPHGRLAQRGQDRAAGQDPDLGDRLVVEPVPATATSALTGRAEAASSAPSRRRPVASANTSSSEGWCSSRCSTRDAGLRRGPAPRRPSVRPRRAGRCTPRPRGRAGPRRRRPRASRARASSPGGHVDLQRRGADGGLELVRAPLPHDPAVVDDGDAAGQLVGLLEVLRGQEHGHALVLVEAPHLLPEGDAAHRVEAGGRLVEEEHGRLVDQ